MRRVRTSESLAAIHNARSSPFEAAEGGLPALEMEIRFLSSWISCPIKS